LNSWRTVLEKTVDKRFAKGVRGEDPADEIKRARTIPKDVLQ